jgi:membrane protein DedA with SNARE-associated domain
VTLATSRAAQCLALFAAPFVHEDVALVMAGTFIQQFELAAMVAFLCLYAGVVASDIAVFALGRAARRVPWLERHLDSPRVHAVGRQLARNRAFAIGVARFVPGLLFSTFTACGLTGMSFRDFLRPALVTSAVYTGVMFALVIIFGEAATHWAGTAGWVLVAAMALVLVIPWLLRRAVSPMAAPAVDGDGEAGVDLVIAGMPAVPFSARGIGDAERLPPWLFYIPLGLRWLWLGLRYRSVTLPTAVDPCIEVGGLWGESKSACLAQIQGDAAAWVARFETVARQPKAAATRAAIEATMGRLAEHGVTWPVVVKPDVGWQGFGVQVVDDVAAMEAYLARYPAGVPLIVQELVPWEPEAGVLYVRRPGETHGRVASLTLRYYPHVVGNGRSTVRELIEREPRLRLKAWHHVGSNPEHTGVSLELLRHVPAAGERERLSFIGSIRVGGLYRDASDAITPVLSARFDAIAQSMPEFWFGRFDIRFASVEQLAVGEAFRVIEVNGAGAEAIHMWDPRYSFGDAYRELLRYQTALFEIGAANRARGFAPTSLRELWRFTQKQNALIAQYPPSQ